MISQINALQQYNYILYSAIICAVALVGGWLAALLTRRKLLPWLMRRLKGRTQSPLTILLSGFQPVIPLAVWLFAAHMILADIPFPAQWLASYQSLLETVYSVSGTLLFCWGLAKCSPICGILLGSAAAQLALKNNARTLGAFVERLFRFAVWTLALLTILGQLGLDVISVITGIGLTGVTVSLAVRDSAADFFSGVSIILEKPFLMGDYILVGGAEGTVEDISFRCTRLRALDNTLMVLPNSKVYSSDIVNCTRRQKWFFNSIIGLLYSTTHAQLEQFTALLHTRLTESPLVYGEDTVIVRLEDFGPSSMDVRVRCYLRTTQAEEYYRMREQINLLILDTVEECGCGFAYPSTSVYFENPLSSSPSNSGSPDGRK